MTQRDTIRGKGRMALSVMTAMMFAVTAFAFISAMPDVNDNAVPGDDAVLGANADVVIDSSDTVSAIQTKIQNELNSAVADDTVTVTGSKTGATSKLELNIDAGVTLVWKAAYTGTFDYGYSTSEGLITIDGGGTFEVASGGTIENVNAIESETVYAVIGNVIVSGGTVKASGTDNYDPIYVEDGNVTVTGGTVLTEGTDGYAISVDWGNVTITGGEVTASGNGGYGIFVTIGNVAVTGGEVNASGNNGYGIYVMLGNVTVSGGTVTASGDNGYGICVAQGNITITGGTVDATGTGTNAIGIVKGVAAYLTGSVSGPLFASSPADSVIVEVDIVNVPLSRDGSAAGVVVKDGTRFVAPADIVWSLYGPQPLLVFDNTSGHINIVWATYGVEVTDPDVSTGFVFASAAEGYSPITPIVFTVQNTGTGNMTNLSIFITGTNHSCFGYYDVGVDFDLHGSVTMGGAGETAILTVNPVAGLSAGTYTATVVFTDDNLAVPYTFDISFTVNVPISISAVTGVTAPAAGGTPVTAIAETAEYTGTVTWSPSDTTFGYATVYTATITLTPKTGYTLTGVAADLFTVAGASASNAADSGIITAVFPATANAPISISAIAGVTVPAAGGTPVTAIAETSQYTGTVTWSPSDATFGYGTVYTATITLTPKTGYTLTGVAADLFTVAGASASNAAGSGVITAVFPATANVPISISAIAGVTVPAAGGTPVTAIAETSQYTGTVTWSPSDATFGYGTVYTAMITLTPKAGYTLTGVAADLFTVAGASLVTNAADSGIIVAVFPATDAAPPEPRTTGGDDGGDGNMMLIIAVVAIAAIAAVLAYVLVIRPKK